jgi:integrase/recombinase XerD
MQAQIQAFLASLESQPAYSSSTRLAYKRDLQHYYQYLEDELKRPPGLPDLTASSILHFLDVCQKEGWSSATALRRKAALKQFVRYLVREGAFPADPFQDPQLSAYRIPGLADASQEPGSLTDEQIRQIYIALERSSRPLVQRDCGILALLLEVGMPVSQLIALNIDDVEVHTGRLRLNRQGDEKEEIWIPLGNAAEPVLTYLREGRVDLHPTIHEKALFISQTGARMSRQGVWQMLRQLGDKAGLGITLSPRLLRHTTAYRMVHQGRNVDELQTYMGHSNPLSTQALIRRLLAKPDSDRNE